MKNISITIADKTVSLQELQNDVNASIEKGYNYNFAFTRHTVQGLIDKVNELSDKKKQFVFSEQHAWQGEEAVQKILVFTTDRMQRKFEDEMILRFHKACNEYVGNDPEYPTYIKSILSDSNAGAIYKLCSVLTGDNNYEACVRCGFTGVMIRDSSERFATPELALEAAMKML